MADVFSEEVRSRIMASIKSKNTRLENSVAKELWRKGFRFRRNDPKLFGKPDISIKKYKVVIFIDSCFWHGCSEHYVVPKSNTEYWSTKIKKNIKRDSEVTGYYLNKKWNILRVWEHELNADFDGTIEKIVRFLEENR